VIDDDRHQELLEGVAGLTASVDELDNTVIKMKENAERRFTELGRQARKLCQKIKHDQDEVSDNLAEVKKRSNAMRAQATNLCITLRGR